MANIVREEIDNQALATSPVNYTFWKRYVDDVVCTVPGNKVEVMLSHINSVDKNLRAKRETEASIAFLDIKITHKPNGFPATSTYKKPTHTDQYLHFSSHHSTAHKSSVAFTILRRAFTHSSTDEEKEKELVRVCNTLTLNGYPHRFVTSKIPEAI